ncbi:MAG: LutC/YkgG family protein [Solirubrobacteraceae bacterium]
MSQTREAILGRIREALRDVSADEPRRWNGPGGPGAADAYRRGPAVGVAVLEMFVEHTSDYRAELVRCPGDESVAREVAQACRRHGARRILAPTGIPPAWLSPTLTWVTDAVETPLSIAALDAADGVLSGACVAIAETGTIALDHRADQGRRALTLVPDLHLCVVRCEQVVATVPEALDLLRPATAEGRPITLISGPSATSDIELERVEGVHGPRRLVVLLRE